MDRRSAEWTDLMGLGREPLPRIWARRAITIPLYFASFVLLLALFPFLAPLAAVTDLVRRSKFALLRMITFLLLYFTFEVFGILASLVLWLAGGPWVSSNLERYLWWNFELQCLWARVLAGGAFKIFSLRLDVEGLEDYSGHPILLFTRHVSTADTVLPALLIAIPQKVMLRYVIKRELLADPCLDIVGHRIPNYFVRRGSGQTDTELRAIRRLTEDLRPGHGVLMYPEGTRFTVKKRERILKRLEETGDEEALQRARAMPLVLPPRLPGSLALLETNPGADAVFCIHTGFESTMSMAQLWRGDLVKAHVRVRFWRIPYKDIPKERNELSGWMWGQWAEADACLQAWKDSI